ncbi:MAG: nitroreductase family protein [Proteobacteria bacterium]|nr:nitroreductase family protein [Pseudomonadota bacterium]
MAGVLEVVKERRSIRKYEDREIPADLFNQVLEAVRWSQSWANCQCWEIVVVKDKARKEELSGTLGKGNPASRAVSDAPVVLALCAKLETSGFYKGKAITSLGEWFMFDLGLAAQSLCLVAHDLGLGTVVVGAYNVDQAAEIIKVPSGYKLACLIPMGFPAKGAPVPPRKEIDEFVRQETF